MIIDALGWKFYEINTSLHIQNLQNVEVGPNAYVTITDFRYYFSPLLLHNTYIEIHFRATWSFSSIHCFNDVLTANSAFNIYEKGAHYRGCFQQNQLVHEDSVALVLFPENYSYLESEQCGMIKNGISSLTGHERAIGAFLSDLLGSIGDSIELLMPRSPLDGLLGIGGPQLFLSLINQAETVATLIHALESFSFAINLSERVSDEFEAERAIPILAYLLKQKKDLLNSKAVFDAVLKITKTSDSDSVFEEEEKETASQPVVAESVNMQAVECLLINLELWRDTDSFRFVLEHLIELIDDPYSTGHLKGRIMSTRICANLLHLIVDDVVNAACIGSAFDLLTLLSESDEQLKQIGKTLVYAVHHSPSSLRPFIKVLFEQISGNSEFAQRFERFFGWELPLSIIDQCQPDDQPYILSLISALFISCPVSAERFLNGQMLQKTESKKATTDDLAIQGQYEPEGPKEDAPKTVNGFKLLEKILSRAEGNVNNSMVILGLLVGYAVGPDQLESSFTENHISSPNQLTVPCFTLLYSLLRHHLSSDDDAATMVIFPLLIELYRDHLPKYGKIFFQEELVQQLVAILYPTEPDKKKLSLQVAHAEKLILDLVISLFQNSVSLGSGSIVFKNVCDAILGISPPPGTTPTQQKAVFTLLVDALQRWVIRYCNCCFTIA